MKSSRSPRVNRQSSSSTWPYAGHAQLGTRLIQALLADRLPPVMLFAGPAHLGKASAAGWLAQFDRCRGTTRPCGRCRACRLILKRQDPGVRWLSANEATIGIDSVRNALAATHWQVAETEREWLIIDGADALTESAANALLKFLEELPPHRHVIMTAAHLDEVPLTVRSRAAVYRWHLVSADERSTEAGVLGRPGWPMSEEAGLGATEWMQIVTEEAEWSDQAWKNLTAAEANARFDHWERVFREVLIHALLPVHSHCAWPEQAERFRTASRKIGLGRLLSLAEAFQRRHRYMDHNVSPRHIALTLLYD